MSESQDHGQWRTTFDDLQRLVSIGVWEWEQETGEVRWSPELYRIFGLDPEQHEPTLERYIESLDPDYQEHTREAVMRAVDTGEPFDHEERILRPDGGMRWLRSVGQRVVGQDGQTVVFGTCQDITERKLLQFRLNRCRRMETVSRMASGLAHDFNNLLSIMTLCAEAISPDRLSAEDAQRLEHIGEAAQSATQLVGRLQRVGREDHPEGALLDLDVVVQDMVPTLEHALGKGITIVVHHDEDSLWIEAAAEHIERILVNLGLNARDAMKGEGTLTLTTGRAEVSAFEVEGIPQAEPGEYVTLSVTDTGEGLPEHMLDEIFEPFVTTKGENGTGLGLAAVDSLVSQAGGFVTVESTLGEGSTFIIHWPATNGDTDGPEA